MLNQHIKLFLLHPVCHITKKINPYYLEKVLRCRLVFTSQIWVQEKGWLITKSWFIIITTTCNALFYCIFRKYVLFACRVGYYRSKVSIKIENDSISQVNPNLKFLIQVPVHFTPCPSTFVSLFICTAPTDQGSCLEVAALEQTELLLVA